MVLNIRTGSLFLESNLYEKSFSLRYQIAWYGPFKSGLSSKKIKDGKYKKGETEGEKKRCKRSTLRSDNGDVHENVAEK